MLIIRQHHKIINWHPEEDFDRIITAARLCYQSEPLDNDDDKQSFMRRLIDRGHLSPLEHSSLSVIFVTNRGVSHELVRHRLASYCQESTRYCNYSKDKFKCTPDKWVETNVILVDQESDNENVQFIWDDYIHVNDRAAWLDSLKTIESIYLLMLKKGYPPQIARGILPNDLKTQIMVTTNLREWRHIFELRCSKQAHPHIRDLMLPLLKEVQKGIPVIFDDILEMVDNE